MSAPLTSAPPPELAPRHRTITVLLGLVLLLAAAARVRMAFVVPPYFDDHWVFNNVKPFLAGSWRPRHSLYGSLSYLPQAFALSFCDALQRWTGSDALRIYGGPYEGFSSFAFRLMRLFVVGYALLSILFTYQVGRRLFSPWVGLAAAAVLAAYPQHLRSAVQLKPDMMVLMLTVLTLWWTARAALPEDGRPRPARVLLAGAGVGLATAAKYIGVASCLPLVAWGAWSGLRDRRRWGWLLLAGVVSVATFFVMNPFVDVVFHFSNRVVGYYGHRAATEGVSRWDVVRAELEFLGSQHGWLLGPCALLALAWMVRRLRRGSGDREAVASLLVLALAVGYPLLHGAAMSLFRTHNLLPALGGTALLCALGMAIVARGVRATLAPARARLVLSLLAAVVVLFLLARPLVFLHGRVATPTWLVAAQAVRERLGPVRLRQVIVEPRRVRLGLADGWRRAPQIGVASLAAQPASELDLADVELFPAPRLAGDQAAFYAARRDRVGVECRSEVSPSPLRRQGPTVIALFHPWRAAAPPLALPLRRQPGAAGGLVAAWPAEVTPGEVVSFELLAPSAAGPGQGLVLQPAGTVLPLLDGGERKARQLLRQVSPRLRYEGGVEWLRLRTAAGSVEGLRLTLHRWAPSSCREGAPAPAERPRGTD
jgi:4-amino-4-deoxy-L-arabinose transferase-like glycosyltransferase